VDEGGAVNKDGAADGAAAVDAAGGLAAGVALDRSAPPCAAQRSAKANRKIRGSSLRKALSTMQNSVFLSLLMPPRRWKATGTQRPTRRSLIPCQNAIAAAGDRLDDVQPGIDVVLRHVHAERRHDGIMAPHPTHQLILWPLEPHLAELPALASVDQIE
jgi:hypothetical protein